LTPFFQIARIAIPGSTEELILSRRDREYSIQISGYVSELMNSRMHHSEDLLAQWGCEGLRGTPGARVLVGGLGMGFTLAAALNALGPDAGVAVAELVPGVVEWNRGELGVCAGRPLDDPRSTVHIGDVGELIRTSNAAYDAILLDVDNGPDAMTHPENAGLYDLPGLKAAARALRPSGVLAIWSAEKNSKFTRHLREAGFKVEERSARARPGKGAHHVVWLARKGNGN
jgi:spermidine synthase